MINIQVTKEALEHLSREAGIDLETAEDILQVCLTLCLISPGETIRKPEGEGSEDRLRETVSILLDRASLYTPRAFPLDILEALDKVSRAFWGVEGER